MGHKSTNFHMAWCLPIYFAKKTEGARMNNLKVWPHLTIIAILVAVVASLVPARHAASVHPMVAMRSL